MPNKQNIKLELVGHKYGRLTILEPGPCAHKRKRTFWLCKCDCGNIKSIREHTLLTRPYPSCGCLRGQRLKNSFSTLKTGMSTKEVLKKFLWSYAKSYIYRNYQHNAKARGLFFDLTPDQFDLLTASNCYYCNSSPKNKCICPKIKERLNESRKDPFIYNGIDRLDNTVGYHFYNCVACCKDCNLAKGTRSHDEFLTWIATIFKHKVSPK